MRVCEICGKVFENNRSFSNHVRWQHKEQKFSEEGFEKLKHFVPRITKKVVCKKCGIEFEVTNTEANFKRKESKSSAWFCSRTCANSRDQTKEETRTKKRETFKKHFPGRVRVFTNVCEECLKTFVSKTRGRRFCSSRCAGLHRTLPDDPSTMKGYRKLCQFKFALNEYPSEFDFNLIKKYGWYKASNHGGDGSGVSRDHKISIRWGFDHHVPPEIMRHPANCELLLHEDNLHTKGIKCSITLEELKKDIEDWNTKYDNKLEVE